MAIKIKSVGTAPRHGWHGRILQNCDYSRTGIDYKRNSDPFDLQENQPTAAGAMSHAVLGTQGSGGNARSSRVRKGAIRRKCVDFWLAPDSNAGFGRLCF